MSKRRKNLAHQNKKVQHHHDIHQSSIAHQFHLVDPSPWPFIGALSACTTTFGIVLWIHDFAIAETVLPFGIFLILYTMIFWWRDIIREGTYEGFHTTVVQVSLRYGMILFIVSEIMFFFGLFWAFLDAAFAPALEGGSIWPPFGLHFLDAFEIPLVNTALLLLSGFSVTWAHYSIQYGYRNGALLGIFATVGMGILFTFCQVYEYIAANFNISDGVYGSAFYMATGFHGFHVMIGTIFLAICIYREYEYQYTKYHHFGMEGASWYWHFVDIVWLFLFISLYWWSGFSLYH